MEGPVSMFKDFKVDLNELEAYIKNSLAGISAEVTVASAEGVKCLSIITSNTLLFDFRITNTTAEVYLNLSIKGYEGIAGLLDRIGLGLAFDLIKELQEGFGSLPKSLIISKTIPSDSIYLLLEPTDSFPPVKGVLRGGEISVIMSSCTAVNDNIECTNKSYLPIINAVLRTLRRLKNLKASSQ
ncbi:MAG: hypothetical protein QXY36_02030 [Sulfolobales archaeon]